MRTTEPGHDDPPTHLRLVSVGPGCRGPREDPRPTKHLLQHRRRAIDAAADLPAGAALSHVSAACLLGLPVWDENLLQEPVMATRRGPGRTICRIQLTIRTGRLDPDEIITVDGIPVTTVARTLVDLGRWATVEWTVVCADAALREDLVSRSELESALARAAGSTGVARARIALSFADGRSAGVAESRARVADRWPDPPLPRAGPDRRAGPDARPW